MDRNGYGTTFEYVEGNTRKINLQLAETGEVLELVGQGNGQVSLEYSGAFKRTNLDKEGAILEMSPSSIVFSPSDATPIAMRVRQTENTADGQYQVYYQTTGGSQGNVTTGSTMNDWEVIASTQITSGGLCQNPWVGGNLPRTVSDGQPSPRCNLATGVASGEAYGISYSSPGASIEKLWYRTIFYSPVHATYFITGACDASNYILAPDPQNPGGTVESYGTSLPITLNYSDSLGHNMDSIADVYGLVGDGIVCVAYSGDNVEFFWNPEIFKDALEESYPSSIMDNLCRGA
jgi:hypothetical protein